MRTIEELRTLLTINRNALDDELVQQPQYYWEASEGYTEASAKRDLSKLVLNRLEADLSRNARMAAAPEKISDKKCADMVMATPSYAEQYERYLGYKNDADRWGALVDSFQQRSSMLRDLVQLHTTGYWGSGIANSRESTYAEKYKERQALKNKELQDEGNSSNTSN